MKLVFILVDVPTSVLDIFKNLSVTNDTTLMSMMNQIYSHKIIVLIYFMIDEKKVYT